jgi:N-dimethylarginine dimethylaminohydrolase
MERWLQSLQMLKAFNGNSMVGSLRRALVCSPRNAGWGEAIRAGQWRELGFLHPPDCEIAQSQHDDLCRQLRLAGVEVIELPSNSIFSLDAVYTHDASLPTDYGAILMNLGKANRLSEAGCHGEFYVASGFPILAEVHAPATCEAGDIVWLDAKTLLIGNGYRTNSSGIARIASALAPYGIQVISAPLPYATGPSACLHLMSLISLLDEKTALVDLPWLAVETVQLLQSRELRLLQIDPSERDTLACNVLSLGDQRLLAIAENERTNRMLRSSGFDVRTFSGSELCINGSGGPTCLTRPLLRE